MANIKRGARAYYADTDYRRDGMNEAYNKIDDIPAIVANPEGTPSAELNTLSIGDTIYKVNDVRVSKILAFRFTIDNGGIYNANLPQISIVNEYDEAAVLPTNTMTCDKPVQYGALTPTGTPGVLTENLPAKITLTFAAEFNIEDYPNIKLTKGGLFPGDIAKNIKIEYSLNSEDWVEIADLVSIDWATDYHIYDMSTGEETTTTPAIPTPTAADAGKFLGVNNQGAWVAKNVPNKIHYINISIAGTAIILPSGITNNIIINWLENGDIVIFKDNNRKAYVIQGWGIPNIDAAKYSFDCVEFTDTTITVSRINIGITNIVYYTHTYTFA